MDGSHQESTSFLHLPFYHHPAHSASMSLFLLDGPFAHQALAYIYWMMGDRNRAPPLLGKAKGEEFLCPKPSPF